MAKNNTNMTSKGAKPQGFKTRKGANNKWAPTPEVTRVKSPEEIKKRNGIILTVIAAVLIVAIVASITGIIIASILKGDKVDYLKDNLSKYINISKDEYTGIEIDIPLVEYDDAMVVAEINKLLVKNKSKDAESNGVGITNKPVALGDVISYRYRIYTVDETDGKQTEVLIECNFNDATDKSLEIGSQKSGFLGFEEKLIGVVPSDYNGFKKIKAGTVSTGDVIYLSYTAFYPTGAASSSSYERIDLSRDDVDAIYGEGFRNFMIGSVIGEKLDSASFKTADGSIGYTDMKVEFATQCEKDCLTVDVVYTADHYDGTDASKDLRGVSAKMDIYIDTAVKYQAPEYNAEFITNTLGMTEAELSSYEGEDIVAKHKAYVKSNLLKSIDRINENLVSEAIWKVLLTKGEVIEYPKSEYETIYNAYYKGVEDYYYQYAESKNYPSIDSAAIDYLELNSGDDWEAYIKSVSESTVKEKLLLYYIIRKEGFLPTDAEYKATYDELIGEWVDYYLERHADEFANYEGAEYDEQLKILTKEVEGIYGNSMSQEAYKVILLRKMQNDTNYVTVK